MEFQIEKIAKETSNLSLVKRFSEDEILQIVKIRYKSKIIYTLAGPALVSVNPNRPLEIYSSLQKKQARESNEYPHIFTIAERAYKGMLEKKDQVIILSGESGSGKSVNANYILEYLSDRMEKKSIVERLVYASPILELFGNASTANNQNSSRFGKYVEIYYESNRVIGANIKAFLLEKGRAQLLQDNNFHAMTLLSNIIAQKSQQKNKHTLLNILANFQKVGVSKKNVLEIFKSLLLVVHLVQIDINENKTDKNCSISGESIEKAADLLGVSSKTLFSLLLQTTITIGKDTIIKNKLHSECIVTKNTLIRVVYEKMFESVVFLINKALAEEGIEESDLSEYLSAEGIDAFIQDVVRAEGRIDLPVAANTYTVCEEKKKKAVKIGVLDIYGFEIMEKNGFDQLCINYANEKIQAEYVRRIIDDNKKAFKEEGISLDNMEVLSQAESVYEGSIGIIKLLDEESFMPGGTVKNWLNKVSSTGTINVRNTSFEISHYAGKVWYFADELIQKNRNTYSDICRVLNQTQIEALWQPEKYMGRLTQVGVIGEFQKSLQSLLCEISKNVLHYVRCIKPGKSDEFCDEYVKAQLRLTGIYETIKIFMLGFFAKTTRTEFMERYSLDPSDISGVQVGNKYVFLTEEAFNSLENNKKKEEAKAAATISAYLYGRYIYQRQVKLREQENQQRLIFQQKQQIVSEIAGQQESSSSKRMSEDASVDTSCSTIDTRTINKEKETANTQKTSRKPAKKAKKKKTQVSELVEFINTCQIKKHAALDDGLNSSEHGLSAKAETGSAPEDVHNKEVPACYAELSPESDDFIKPVLKDAEENKKGTHCTNCYKTEEKYAAQVLYLAEREELIDKLKSDLQSASASIKEKNILIRDLGHKIEVMLYELSSGEYFKTTTNPQQTSRGIPLSSSAKESDEKAMPIDMLFRQICKLFIQNIPSAHPSYYHSVSYSFALFRISAICNGGISENISVAVKEFFSSAYAILVIKKSSIPLYTGFFLTNAIFIARTSPSVQTSEMLQSIFSEGCKAITEEIVNFGFDFLFKLPISDNGNLLSRLLKKPSLDSVICHLKMIHSVLSNLYVPKAAIISIFEYIARTIDALGFEYITKKEKRIAAKNLMYLHNSLDTLSSLLIDVSVQDPYSCFPYLRKFTEFVEIQKKGFSSGSILLQIGTFTSSQLMACVSALSPEIRGPCAEKLENALKKTTRIDKVSIPSFVFSMPLSTHPDDPNELYNALSICPEKEALCSLLEKFGVSYSWLNN